MAAGEVSRALHDFEHRLQSAVAYLDGSYGIVSQKAMLGDWQPAETLFAELLGDFLGRSDPGG